MFSRNRFLVAFFGLLPLDLAYNCTPNPIGARAEHVRRRANHSFRRCGRKFGLQLDGAHPVGPLQSCGGLRLETKPSESVQCRQPVPQAWRLPRSDEGGWVDVLRGQPCSSSSSSSSSSEALSFIMGALLILICGWPFILLFLKLFLTCSYEFIAVRHDSVGLQNGRAREHLRG